MCASLSTCVGVRASCVGGGAAAEKLATLGADLNVRNQLGSTALHYAAMEGHTATCQKLLKLGADLAAVNEAGSSALALAVPLLVCVLCCGWEGGRTEGGREGLNKLLKLNPKHKRASTRIRA